MMRKCRRFNTHYTLEESHQHVGCRQNKLIMNSNVMFSRIVSKNIAISKRTMSTTSSPFTQAVVAAMRKL